MPLRKHHYRQLHFEVKPEEDKGRGLGNFKAAWLKPVIKLDRKIITYQNILRDFQNAFTNWSCASQKLVPMAQPYKTWLFGQMFLLCDYGIHSSPTVLIISEDLSWEMLYRVYTASWMQISRLKIDRWKERGKFFSPPPPTLQKLPVSQYFFKTFCLYLNLKFH